jgi:hypothetical protein
MPNAHALMEKIQALPPERLNEVEDFVDFIRLREQTHAYPGRFGRERASLRRDLG